MIKHIIDTILNNSMFLISILIFFVFMIIGFFGDRHFQRKYSIKDTSTLNDGLYKDDFSNKENVLKKVGTSMEPAIEIKLPKEGNIRKAEKQKGVKEEKYLDNIKEINYPQTQDKKDEEESLLNNDDWGSFNFDSIGFEEKSKKDHSDEEENVNNIF